MSEILGFIAVLIAVIVWGSNFVPMRMLKKYNVFFFQAIMVSGIFVSSLIFVLFMGEFILNEYGILSGLLWLSGNTIAIMAVKKSGISRAIPIWMGVGMSIAFIWGIFFFKETLSIILFGILGIILLIVGINVVSFSRDKKMKSDNIGIVLAAISGVFFGSYLVPLQLSGIEPAQFLFSMSLSILISGWVLFFIKRSDFDMKVAIHAFVSGVGWNIANFASLFVVLFLGLAVGMPLTQIALLVSILWGVLYFKEIRKRNKIIQIIIGAVIIIIGAFLLGSSR